MQGQIVEQHRFQSPKPKPLSLREQIKLILAMSGGAFSSIKKLKAIYAVLQSLAPDKFYLSRNA